jgi:hypothetical protein
MAAFARASSILSGKTKEQDLTLHYHDKAIIGIHLSFSVQHLSGPVLISSLP